MFRMEWKFWFRQTCRSQGQMTSWQRWWKQMTICLRSKDAFWSSKTKCRSLRKSDPNKRTRNSIRQLRVSPRPKDIRRNETIWMQSMNWRKLLERSKVMLVKRNSTKSWSKMHPNRDLIQRKVRERKESRVLWIKLSRKEERETTLRVRITICHSSLRLVVEKRGVLVKVDSTDPSQWKKWN